MDGTKGDDTQTETESDDALSEREEGRIIENGPVVCLRKRKPDDVSTSVLSVEVNEIQTSVGESSFWLRARLFRIFKVMGIRTSGCEIIWMRDDLESIYMLLFRLSGTVSSWRSATWAGLRPGSPSFSCPIPSSSWSVLLDRGVPCDSCQDTSDEAAS